MEKLIKQASELVASLQEAKAEVLRQGEQLDREIKANAKLKDELAKQQADLDAREAVISAQEKPMHMLEQAKAIQAVNKKTLENIDIAQKALEKERNLFAQKLVEEKSRLDAEKELADKQRETLKAGLKKLDEDRKKYKDDVISKLKVAV